MTKIDHTTIKPGGPGESPFPTGTDRLWWEKSGEEAAQSISASLQLLEEQEKTRGSQLVRSLRLYGNVPMHGFTGLGPHPSLTVNQGPYRDRLSYNVVQIVSDAITSKMAKNRPRPYYLTSGGNWNQRARAKRLNKFNDGVFYENKAYDIGIMAFRDCCVLDAGVVYVFVRNGRVVFERVPSVELKVDELEGFYGFPRQMHRLKLVDRQVLERAFPSKKELINKANSAWAQETTSGRPHISDLLLVRESWHLPSGPGAKDGKHIVTIPEGPLTALGDWNHNFFPFAVMRWSPKLVGFWGQSLTEQLQPIQLEINKLLYLVQRSYHLGGSFKILLEMGSKIAPEHINNEIGALIKYQGTKPEYIVPPILPPEIYSHLQWLVDKAYETGRISQLSAVGVKPSGLNSGEAQRVYHDIESDGFQTVGKAYERFYLDISEITRAVTLDFLEQEGRSTYQTHTPNSRWSESNEVSRKDLKPDDCDVLQCFPVSSLPAEPAGRLATIQEWVQAGWLDARTGKKLMNFPDTESEESLSTAVEDYLEKTLSEMIEADEDYNQVVPEPYDNPQLGFELAQQYYLAGKRDGLEEYKLERLRIFMDQCRMLVQAAMMPAAPAPGSPTGVPAPPPQSELLPNTPS